MECSQETESNGHILIPGTHISRSGMFCEEFVFDVSSLPITTTDPLGIKKSPRTRSVDYVAQLLEYIAESKYPPEVLKYFKSKINNEDEEYYSIVKNTLSSILYEDRRGRVIIPKIKIVPIKDNVYRNLDSCCVNIKEPKYDYSIYFDMDGRGKKYEAFEGVSSTSKKRTLKHKKN